MASSFWCVFRTNGGFTESLTSPGDVTDHVPGFDEICLFALQPDDALIRPFLKVLVFVKAFLRLLEDRRQTPVQTKKTSPPPSGQEFRDKAHLVKSLQVADWRRDAQVVWKLVLQVSDQHPELGPPVPDMVQPAKNKRT